MSIDVDEKFVAMVPGAGHQIALIFDDEIVITYPILGFLIYETLVVGNDAKIHYIYPVTVDEVHTGNQDYAIIRPDGKVDQPEVQSFDSLQKFEAYLRSEKQRKTALSKERGKF